ncbi:hypothetical protein [Pontibacter pamirensis]|uniref:hypothetical protein n=1 Tax=Pontibacter pamirensis TaxID=2562824 RepID=UPI001389B64B|nr:hypothetical protein [Pontibacter pamirensis]
MNQRLQFIYNAKTGLFNKLTDFAHKAISPATYNCNLCALTYGTFTMKQEWSDYIKSLPLEVAFIYRDEWKYKTAHRDYPLVALQTGEKEPEVLLEASQLNELKSLQELKQAIQAALQDAGSKNTCN